jgi:hypothetical protein
MQQERTTHIRQQAITALELTKGFIPEQRAAFSNELKTVEEFAHYILELTSAQHPAGCEWVKASERLPGWGKSVRWRLDGIERKACDVFYMANGESPACIPNYEWYDEFPSKEGNKEREVALIQYIRENYKPSKEVWKDKFGIALLSDEGVLNKFNEWNNQQNRNND